MYHSFGISDEVVELVSRCEKKVASRFQEIDDLCDYQSLKVLSAFQKNQVSENHFATTTGYGYGDVGRDAIEKVFADVLGAEDCLVRSQFISGSHALTVALFAFLRPGDMLLSISGKPYDTLDEVIGIVDNPSSLKSFGVSYSQIDLVRDDFDYDQIASFLKDNQVKVIAIQRSKGYSTRKSLSLEKLEKVIDVIRSISPDVIIMVDNCYCELVSRNEPLSVGADVIVGSLIKNLGGGIAPNGGYIAGRHDLILLAADRLTVPGEGREVGPTLGINKSLLQGLYMAPQAVASSLKTAVLASSIFEELGYLVDPGSLEERVDIVQNIQFGDPDLLIRYCQGIQMGSAIDSFAIPEAWDMPGYQDPVVMASGSFTQGSSIELSCDGPIRPPYVAYMQGSLTYAYGKLGVMKAVQRVFDFKKNNA